MQTEASATGRGAQWPRQMARWLDPGDRTPLTPCDDATTAADGAPPAADLAAAAAARFRASRASFPD